jgi:hypothetical protein
MNDAEFVNKLQEALQEYRTQRALRQSAQEYEQDLARYSRQMAQEKVTE